MLHDAGICVVKRGSASSSSGSMPTYTWTELFSSYYGEKTVGINRYWTAKANNAQADMLIEIQRKGSILPTDKVTLTSYVDDGVSGDYRIIQVQHALDDDNLPCTLLTLERVEGKG